MGSAGLKYGPDGKVAWDQIWGSFCDLAMAGGPPHKGKLLEPGSREAIDAAPARYEEVVDEICRGITLASELPAQPSAHAGWVSVDCYSETMASWLLRAIVMENVAARSDGRALAASGGPAFRARQGNQERHHRHRQDDALLDGAHVARAEERDRGSVRKDVAVVPAYRTGDQGLAHPSLGEGGWRGVASSTVKAAVWMMRAMVVNNVLSRREGTTLFVPREPGERSGRSDRGEDGDGGSPPRRDSWRRRLTYASAFPKSASSLLHALSACSSLYGSMSGGHQPCAAG